MQFCALGEEKELMNFQPVFVMERRQNIWMIFYQIQLCGLGKFSHFSVKQEVSGERGRRVQGLRKKGVMQNGGLSGWRVNMLRGQQENASQGAVVRCWGLGHGCCLSAGPVEGWQAGSCSLHVYTHLPVTVAAMAFGRYWLLLPFCLLNITPAPFRSAILASGPRGKGILGNVILSLSQGGKSAIQHTWLYFSSKHLFTTI